MTTNTTAFADLMAHQRQTEALGFIAERLGWDQETMMPRGGAEQRGEEMAALEGVMHARRTNPQIAQWLADAQAVDAVAAAQLHHIDRSYSRSVKVPGDLAEALARVTSVAQGTWAAARSADRVADFLPTLREVIGLKRQEAECLATGGDLYDALIDDYEPGATAESLGGMFDRMRPRLVALRGAVLDCEAPPALQGHFAQDAQPVSYTHLDVYKRQEEATAGGGRFGRFAGGCRLVDGVERIEGEHGGCGLLSFGDASGAGLCHSGVCLLYTSRCV